MSNNHVLTREIGNLRGFSTDSIYLRPSNVATEALNLQRSPDNTLQIRRGYQCQIGQIGGMGIGTFDDPAFDIIHTVTVGMDGYLYNKLERQIYLHYNGQVTGVITNITNPSAELVQVTSDDHGLITGAQVILRNIVGSIELNNPGNFDLNFYTITVVDANNYILNGINYSDITPYISGGIWSIAFADSRYLSLNIYVDPRFIDSFSGQSINCNMIVNKAAQVNGNQTLVNTINVQFGHSFMIGQISQFYDINGVNYQRSILSTTTTSITIDGSAVSVNNNTYINQFVQFVFGKGYDVVSPYLISTFIATATSASNGVFGLTIAINGNTNLPAAFIQILETTLIPSNTIYTLDYWYWQKVNSTLPSSPPLPGSANPFYQNSQEFENASMAAYDDVIYIANGWDYPQKYDGQTIYRTGMPIGIRTTNSDNTTFESKPFSDGNVYEYATTYEQIDARGHIVEGEISEINIYDAGTTTCACNVTLTNLQAKVGANWNTDFALAVGGTSTAYGPDISGFYYDLVAVNTGFTLKIGDSAYYGDTTAAVITGSATGFTIPVSAGHAVLTGDTIYFFDTSSVEHQRIVASVTATSINIMGADVTVGTGSPNILDYKVSRVFGNVAIVNGNQTNVNTIAVQTGYTIQVSDIVQFFDSQNNMQQRNVTAIGTGTITIDGIPVNVSNLHLIYSTNQRTNAVTFQRLNANPATLSSGATGDISNAISNNLRINIYRTLQGESFGTNGELFLVSSIPNDGSGAAVQIFIDGLPDSELTNTFQFDDPDQPPNPPPISKYLRAFGTQMFYAGGERGNAENSDRVFFSGFSGSSSIAVPNPEVVPLATNFFNVPNVDDEITGIGVAGTTLVTTKNNSLWAATGQFFTGQIEVVQIAPGSNIGCAAHATIASVGTLMYFMHTNGVYAITENQLFPTDPFGNPIPISIPIDKLFRQTNFLPWTKYIYRRAVGFNYTKENQYLLFLPCEDTQATIRTANANSILLAYDYQEKNWFKWDNMNCAGGFVVIDDDLYFQERRYSGVNSNTSNLYKQHRFYRLVDHADHAGAQNCEWLSSWEDMGQPRVRKKFSKCILLMDRLSDLLQYNDPKMIFSSYLDRLPGLQNTISYITQVDNIRNAGWSISPWDWGYWSGYQDAFIDINLKQGTAAKSIQVGFKMHGINQDIRLAGFQLEVIPENRKTAVR
jgi:hypothetical protein